MKSLYIILSISLIFVFSLKAEEKMYERVFVHTDKDVYIAGEDIQLKFYTIDNNFQPSSFSKVGYVEICDTEKPHIQIKIALKKGHGAGVIRIPANVPSGIYILSGYTRFMRNEDENVFFNKQIAIVNTSQQTADSKRFNIIREESNDQAEVFLQSETNIPYNLPVKTDKNEYGNRREVFLSLDNIPENTVDLVVSVSRNDSIAFVQKVDIQEWQKQAKMTSDLSKQWTAEYEGHIITGRIIPELHENQLLTNISFVGKDIRYIMGQINPQNGTANFYTSDMYGKQHIVASAVSYFYDKTQHRIDLVNPFSESLPKTLPVMQIFPNEKQLSERHIGAQILERTENSSQNYPNQITEFYNIEPVKSYNLDEYTRFESVGETILEFVTRIHVSRLRGKRVISAYLEETKQFSLRTLVLLDGIPIYNHEDILQYNPMYIKTINLYDGRYLFGNENYECVISFITHDNNLPNFQLGEESQLFDYECPQLPSKFEAPDYSTDLLRNSRKPDFRHTLYWNPFVNFTKDKPVNLSFYTSDLCGEFKVMVEGITTDGKIIHGASYFQVIP